MKTHLSVSSLLLFLFLFSEKGFSQHWQSINGETRALGTGRSITDTSCKKCLPSARNFSANALWESDFYIFGGFGLDRTGKRIALNDFWKYDVARNKWECLFGGSQELHKQKWNTRRNIADKNVIPLPRYATNSWTYNDKFYVFGGFCMTEQKKFLLSNELWSYDLKTKIWMLEHGDTVYNSTGKMNTSEKQYREEDLCPSARQNALTWQYKNMVYLMGGIGINEKNVITNLSDFWKYDIENNKWSLVEQDSSLQLITVLNSRGFGLRRPAFITDAATWTIDNYLVLYGGNGYNKKGEYSKLSDMWVYEVPTGIWTKTDAKTYSDEIQSNRYSVIHPNKRSKSVVWSHKNILYLYGGYAIDSRGSVGYMDDFWAFDFAKMQWNRIGGSPLQKTTIPSYFISHGTYDKENTPGSRISSASFTYNNELYMFSGLVTNKQYTDLCNDFWKYKIPAAQTQIARTNLKPATSRGSVQGESKQQPDNTIDETGANSLGNQDIVFAPNPVTDMAYIYSPKKIDKCVYQIFDQAGSIKGNGEIPDLMPNDKFYFDMKSLSPGQYYINLKSPALNHIINFSKK